MPLTRIRDSDAEAALKLDRVLDVLICVHVFFHIRLRFCECLIIFYKSFGYSMPMNLACTTASCVDDMYFKFRYFFKLHTLTHMYKYRNIYIIPISCSFWRADSALGNGTSLSFISFSHFWYCSCKEGKMKETPLRHTQTQILLELSAELLIPSKGCSQTPQCC